MFTLLNRLTHFSTEALVHLESRLHDSPALQDLTFLRLDETNPENVVLASRKRGTGSIRCSFPAAFMRNAMLRHRLDREIDRFLACYESDPEAPVA